MISLRTFGGICLILGGDTSWLCLYYLVIGDISGVFLYRERLYLADVFIYFIDFWFS